MVGVRLGWAPTSRIHLIWRRDLDTLADSAASWAYGRHTLITT
jgi:hypothetical protein